MNNKKYLFIVVAVCIIMFKFIAGCNFLTAAQKIDYRKGKEGLKIDITGPSDLITYGIDKSTKETYKIIISNRGATPLEEGDIYLKIHLDDDFLLQPEGSTRELIVDSLSKFYEEDPVNKLEGKTRYDKDGESIEYILTLQGNPPKNQGTTGRIKAELCYRYETILSDSVCINTKINEEKKGCDKNEYLYYQGQGAPIMISKVEIRETEEDDGAIKPKIVLTVENAKGNLLSNPDSEPNGFKDACIKKENINTIKIASVMLGTSELKCNEGNDTVEIKKNEVVVLCEPDDSFNKEGNLGNYYDTTLYVKLDYGYYENVEKEVNVLRENYDE